MLGGKGLRLTANQRQNQNMSLLVPDPYPEDLAWRYRLGKRRRWSGKGENRQERRGLQRQRKGGGRLEHGKGDARREAGSHPVDGSPLAHSSNSYLSSTLCDAHLVIQQTCLEHLLCTRDTVLGPGIL